MFKKDFEGEAEWWRIPHTSPLRTRFYIRLETGDSWNWYRVDDETYDLLECDEVLSTELEERRDEGT